MSFGCHEMAKIAGALAFLLLPSSPAVRAQDPPTQNTAAVITCYPVITRGNGKEVNILLKHVARTTATASSAGASGAARLEGTTWNLTRLGEKDVVASENQRQPYILLESSNRRLTGSGGCNRLNGTYTLDKQTIHFGPIASTMMACPAGMDLEGVFLHALDKSHRWKVQGNKLELWDENDAFLMRFEAAPPEK